MACTWNGWSHHWRVVTPKHLLHWYDDLVFMQKILLVFLILFFSLKNSYSDNNIKDNSPEIFEGVSVELDRLEIQESLNLKENGKSVSSKNWMIVTANAYASAAGAKILQSGGTAADAMVAAQSVLGLVEPESSGIGGGSFLLWYDGVTGKIVTLDGRETAPQNSTSNQFLKSDGSKMKFFDAVIGGLSVGTPGTLALMFDAQKKWGNQNWENLFDEAIFLSKNGFKVSKKLSSSIERDKDRLSKIDKTKEYFLPNGNSLKHKQVLKNYAYASTMQNIANNNIEDFYKGSIAQDIVSTVKNHTKNPGFLEAEDLSNYNVIERDPVCVNYKVYKICGMGPPSSGGVAVAQILKILEPYDLQSLGYSNPITWQIIGDATRLAFADRDRYLADSDYVSVPLSGLLNDNYLIERSNKIKVGTKTENVTSGKPSNDFVYNYGIDNSLELQSTTHISIYDQYGNALSMTSSIENAFGSRLMTESGFLLNNQLTDFSFNERIDGKLIANRLEPGKRPRSSMAPTIVLKDGRPIIIIGSPGGSNIISFVVNSIIALLEWDMNIQEAVSHPHAINRWGKFEIEESLYSSNLENSLKAMGYDTKIRKYYSGLNGIYIDTEIYGGSDPRREGIALGN